MLMVTHMHDLKDVTRDVHYENYRAHYITRTMRETAATGNIDDVIALQQHQQQQRQLLQQTQQQLQVRMSTRTASKEKILKQKDAEIARMQDMILQMQKQLTTTTTTTTTTTMTTMMSAATSTAASHAGMTTSSSSSSINSQTGKQK